MGVKSRQIRLARDPHGLPAPEDFTMGEVEMKQPLAGHVVIGVTRVSLDPYMRG